MRLLSRLFLFGLGLFLAAGECRADIFATGFFSGTIQRFNETTFASSAFATIAGNPGLSGIAYNSNNNRFYVSALNHGGVYMLDGATGSTVGFAGLGIGPGGIAVGSNGNVYVTDFTSNNVRVYDTTMTNLLNTIVVPVPGVTSGVGFAQNGDVIIATPGTGVFQYDGNAVTPFNAQPFAAAQVTSSVDGIFIGHGIGQSNDVFRFDSAGNFLNTLTITSAMMPGAPAGSSSGFSPSGVGIDADGNVIVAVLGRSNPGDAGGEFGAMFKFDVDGNLLDTIAVGTMAFSGLALANPVPEPGTTAFLLTAGFGCLLFRRRKIEK